MIAIKSQLMSFSKRKPHSRIITKFHVNSIMDITLQRICFILDKVVCSPLINLELHYCHQNAIWDWLCLHYHNENQNSMVNLPNNWMFAPPLLKLQLWSVKFGSHGFPIGVFSFFIFGDKFHKFTLIKSN